MAAQGPWTDRMVEDLRRRWQRGETATNVAIALQVSRNAVIGKVHRLGLSGRPSPIRRGGAGGSRPPAPRSRKRPTPRAPTTPAGSSAVACAAKPTTPTPALTVPPADQGTEKAAPKPPVYRDAPTGRPHTCCWPIGEAGTTEFHFCDRSIDPPGSYCAAHHARAYVTRPRRREEDADHG